MKRRLEIIFVLVCVMLVVSGCRMYTEYTVNENHTVTVKSKTAYSEASAPSLHTDGMTLEMLEDGNMYYVQEDEPKTESFSDLMERGVYISEDVFYFPLGLEGEKMEIEDGMYVQLTVNLLSNIEETNANVSSSGKTAVFCADGKLLYWYAYTKKGKKSIEEDKQPPTMQGAKNGKYYKKMPANIRFLDDIAVKEVTLNGQSVSNSISTVSSGEKVTQHTKWLDAQGKEVYKNGKNVFKVTDLGGNTATYTIYIDTKSPIIKGVKNKKRYNKKAAVYVKDNVKLSKVTINGKKQKLTNKQLVKSGKYKGYYKYTVKKKGTNKIVVKDAAGNKKTMTIKIRK